MIQVIIKSGGLFGSWFWCPGNPKAWYQHLVRAFLLHPDMTESIMWCDGPSVLPQGSLPPLIKVTNIITGAPRSYSHLIRIFLSRVPSLSIISIWIWGLSLQHLNFGNIFKLKKAPCGNDMTLQHKAPSLDCHVSPLSLLCHAPTSAWDAIVRCSLQFALRMRVRPPWGELLWASGGCVPWFSPLYLTIYDDMWTYKEE